MTDSPLHGFGVLVTRPTHQAAELIQAIEEAGGEAIRFPVLSIVPRKETEISDACADLECPDIAIFVSRNAVEYGIPYVDGATIAATGPATATALRNAGRSVEIEPTDGYDSESLLEHPDWKNVTGKRIRIIRGGPGRDLLANTLNARGAKVHYLDVYAREPADVSPEIQSSVESAWRDGRIGAITVMSVETLNCITELLPEWCSARLDSIPLVTPAARVLKEILHRYPSAAPVLAPGPAASDMLQAIISIHRNDLGQVT